MEKEDETVIKGSSLKDLLFFEGSYLFSSFPQNLAQKFMYRSPLIITNVSIFKRWTVPNTVLCSTESPTKRYHFELREGKYLSRRKFSAFINNKKILNGIAFSRIKPIF